MSPTATETAAEFWRRRHGEAVDVANRRIADAEAAYEHLLKLRESDAWLETALLQLLHENGIEPSSYMLIDAFKRAKGISDG